MGADGLAKMATSHVMSMLRNIQHGDLPDIPVASAEIAIQWLSKPSEESIVAMAVYGSTPMTHRRRQAEHRAFEILYPHGGHTSITVRPVDGVRVHISDEHIVSEHGGSRRTSIGEMSHQLVKTGCSLNALASSAIGVDGGTYHW